MLLQKLIRLAVTYPRAVLLAIGALTLVLASFGGRVRLKLDGRSLIPADYPAIAESDRAAAKLGARDVVLLGVEASDGDLYRPATLALLARLTDQLAQVPGVARETVFSLARAPSLAAEGNTLSVKPLLQRGEPPEVTRQRVADLGFNNNLLLANNGGAALIFAEVEPDADRYRLLEDINALIANETEAGHKLHLSGTALAQAVLGEASARDLLRLVPLSILVMGVILCAAFRHPLPALLSLTEIGLSLIWVVGLMGLGRQPVFVTTLVLPVVLLAVGVSDDVYALSRYFAVARAAPPDTPTRELVAQAFGGISRSVLFTALSTIVGLLSIAVSSLQPLRVFGVFGALAIFCSGLFTFTLIPALLVTFNVRPPAQATAPTNSWRLAEACDWRTGTARLVLASALLVLGLAVFSLPWLRVDDSWMKNLPPDSVVARGDAFFNQRLAGTTTLDFMLDSGRPEGALQTEFLAVLRETETALAKTPEVGATDSVYNDVARAVAALRKQTYAAYRDDLQAGRKTLTAAEIAQAGVLLQAGEEARYRRLLDEQGRYARLTVFVRDADYPKIARVAQTALALLNAKLAPLGGQAVPFGDGWISYLTVGSLVKGQAYSILLALLTDFLLLSWLFKSPRAALLALCPLVFSLFVMFAALAWSGTPLGIANSMFAGITLGIGLDFSIHLAAAYRHAGGSRRAAMRQALQHTGPAILTSALAISAGFAVLFVSEVTPNRQLGVMICLSLLVCAAATLILLPALALCRKVSG